MKLKKRDRIAQENQVASVLNEIKYEESLNDTISYHSRYALFKSVLDTISRGEAPDPENLAFLALKVDVDMES